MTRPDPRPLPRPRSRPRSQPRTSPTPDPRRRILVVLGAFVVLATVLVGTLADLQTIRPDRYRELGEDQRTRTRELAGYRGSLVDRNGFVLAASTPGRELVADPTLVRDPAAAAAVLAPVIGADPQVLQAELTPQHANDRYELLFRTTDEATIEILSELDAADRARGDERVLAGVFLRAEEARVYPAGTLARPLVGGVDDWEQGTFGLEKQFNAELQGSPGQERSEEGIFGSIAGGLWEVDPAEKGYDLVLTIDHRIQFITEEALVAHCEETGATSAQAVVSDPRSGELLAMATVVRQTNGACRVPNSNAPLVTAFEPGSVLKVLPVAAAVEDLGKTGETLIDVPSSVWVGDVEFHEHPGHVAAPYPLAEVIADSLNVGTINVATEVGAERLYDYYQRFGFGQYSGLDFEGETRGRVRTPSEWYGSDVGSIAIGQGVQVNAVQVLGLYSALANDGMYVAPRVVRAAIDSEGIEYDLAPQDARRVVSAETADEVTGMLVDVVDYGTGTEAAVEGYTVAGKTGTAWKVFDDGSGQLGYGSDGNRRYVMSFAGFAPAEDPAISIVVAVDEPASIGNAGSIAAPVFADIAQYALEILAVPPTDLAEIGTERVRGTPAPDPNTQLAAASATGTEAVSDAVTEAAGAEDE